MPSRGTSMVRDWGRDLDEIRSDIRGLRKSKVDDTVMNVKFEGAERMQEQMVSRLTENMEGIKSDVSQLSKKISRRSGFQLGGIVALVVAIVGGAMFIIKLTSQVETTTEKVETNTKSVKILTDTVKRTQKDVKAIKESGEAIESRRLLDMKSALRTVLDEENIKFKSRGRR